MRTNSGVNAKRDTNNRSRWRHTVSCMVQTTVYCSESQSLWMCCVRSHPKSRPDMKISKTSYQLYVCWILTEETGYKLLNVENRHLIQSRDVVFREDIFAQFNETPLAYENPAKACNYTECLQASSPPEEANITDHSTAPTQNSTGATAHQTTAYQKNAHPPLHLLTLRQGRCS